MKYFVMLNKWNGWHGFPTPLVEEDLETVCLFDSEAEGEQAGEANSLGAAYGYDVYEWPAHLFEGDDSE